MIITQYYNFEAPELCDAPDVSYLSVNWQDLDGILHDKADLGIDGKVLATQLPSMNYVTPTGDGSTVTVSFTEAATNIDIATGDTLAVMAGKLLKNIHSLQTATGNNATAISNIINGTTKVGSASNADTVGGFTVGKSVPANALFTDTVYTHPSSSGNKHIPSGGVAGQFLKWSADGTAVWAADNNTIYTHPSTHPYSMITGAPSSLPANGGNADTVDGYHLANRTNWSGVTNNIVVGQLMWKNYGNNHTIFDASNGTTPSGTACSNSTPDAGWSPNFPVLMGWNGYNTYGVKVNCADWANSSGNVDGVSLSGLAESKITSGTNLNTITKSGMYRIDVAPNTPLGLAYGQLIVMHGGGDTITQIYGDYYTGKLYTRSGAIPELGGGGSWSQWKGITTSLGTAKEIWVGAEASRGSDANTLYFCY